MKNIFAILLLCLPFSAIAQKIYIKPTVGIGQSGTNIKWGVGRYEKSPGFKAEVATGIQISKLRLETGIGYFNWAYKLTGLVFEDNFDLTTGQITSYTDVAYRYSYIYMPLRVAYKIGILPHLFLVPSAGIDVTCKLSSERTLESFNPPVKTTAKVTANNIGALGDGMLLAEYQLGNISVTAGASFKYMLNEMTRGSGQHPSLLSADAGILYHF